VNEKTHILRRVYGVLSTPEGRGTWPRRVLSEILSHTNHQADLYLITEDPMADWTGFEETLDETASFLREWGFCRLNLRPVHPVGRGDGNRFRDLYQAVLGWGTDFHGEALAHQVVSRWMVTPILRARDARDVDEVLGLAGFLRERMMIPSFTFPASPRMSQWVVRVDTGRERILLEEGREILETLFLHDLFDDLLQWSLSSSGGFSVEPCAGLILDGPAGAERGCPRREARGYGELKRVLAGDDPAQCVACWNRLPGRVRETLRWNNREEEGARVRHQLGVFALSRQDLPMAREHFTAGLRSPSSQSLRGENLLYLGILHLQQGETEDAHRALTEASSLLPESATALYHLGRCEFAANDFIAASDLFHKAMEMALPSELEQDLRLYLGIAHVRLEEFPEAMQVLDMAREDRAPIRFYRGMAVLGLKRFQEALEHFQAALALKPDSEDLSSVLFYIGHTLKEMGRFEETVAFLQRSLEADPGSYEAWNLLGYCCFRLGRHQEAIEAFRKALEIQPRSAIDFANIGSNLRDLGDLEGAAKWYRRALKLDPGIGFAVENLRRIQDGTDTRTPGIQNPESRIQNPEGEH
jgi:tetratricopeptide (TPR) repeat protein